MSKIPPIDPTSAQGKTRELLGAVQKMLGATPNLFRVTAQAPSALEAMVSAFGAAAHGSLSARAREAIALAVSEANGCDYCLSAHSALGKGAGLSENELLNARQAKASDPKTTALLRFARTLTLERGNVGAPALAELRQAGASDAEVLEVIANVALTIFTNYVNLVADTDIDFPLIRRAVA